MTGPTDRVSKLQAAQEAAGSTAAVDKNEQAANHEPGAPALKLAHLSDTHLAYQAYAALSASGDNQRALDFIRAFVAACRAIVDEDPPLVVHSGDVGDRPRIDVRYLLLIKQWFVRLAGIRPDGSRRQLVVISGNHDQPRHHKEACFLELFSDLPGVHVVTNRYAEVTFTDPDAPPELARVSVHALPHDQLKSVDFADVCPTPGRVNILVAHGVAGGSEIYRRTIGREYAIPTDVLGRPWEYVALGHYHKQGPVPLVAAGGHADRPEVGRAWYAGSTENNGFRDLVDGGSTRGWLSVEVTPGQLPTVTRRPVPVRLMLRLPVIEAQDMAPDQVAAAMAEHLHQAEVRGAVVGQIVTGVRREVWALVDQGPARAAAAEALHYAVSPRFSGATKEADEARPSGVLGDLGAVLAASAELLLPAAAREGALGLARQLLGSALAAPDPVGRSPEDPATGDLAAEDQAADDQAADDHTAADDYTAGDPTTEAA